jgi:hypothetical protein
MLDTVVAVGGRHFVDAVSDVTPVDVEDTYYRQLVTAEVVETG